MVDVARLAGVSHQTVSRYIHADAGIREETREKVRRAIEELDYRPNLLARSMRTRRSGLLAIILPANASSFTPARIVGSATATAHDAGYEVEVISVEGGGQARADRMLALCDSGLVEGVLTFAPIPEASLARVRRTGAPAVVSAEYDDELRGIGELLDAAPIAEIVEHLVSLGHRAFYMITGPLDHPSAREREAAYLRTVTAAGATSLGTSDGSWSARSGMHAVANLPDDSPVTAIVCANDELAAGAIRAAIDRGWTVPEHVSVTGWDNNPLGEFLPPGLTTVSVDHELLGQRSMRRLIAAVRREESSRNDEDAPLMQVIWRGSVGPPRD
jgi:DNA-binding LacI/PurR family transcriptional regulator